MYNEVFFIIAWLSSQLFYSKVLLLSTQYPTWKSIVNIEDNSNYGVFTYYTPLNQLLNLAQTQETSEQTQTHLFSAYFEEHTIIAYQIINADILKIYHVIKIQSKVSNTMVEYQFEQDYLRYEGIEVGTIFSYSQDLQELQLKVYTEHKTNTFQIDNIFLQKQNVEFIFGGINNEFNLIGFQGIIFLVLSENYQTKIDYLYSISCYKSRKDFSIESMEYVSKNSNIFNIPITIYKEYYMEFWNKFDTQISPGNLIQFLVLETQIEIDPKYSLGRNTLQLYYDSLSYSDLLIYCKYYSFEFPYNYYNVDYIQSLVKDIEIIHIDPIVIQNWHYVRIQYQNESLTVQVYFPNLDKNIQVEIKQVKQFSQTGSQITINSMSNQDVEIKGQIASFIFNSCMQDFSIFQPCHFSCYSCFGPFYNNCLSCQANSNRIYNQQDQTCICSPWTLDKNNTNCFDLLEDSNVQIEYEQTSDIQGYDQIEPQIICSFGYFLYDGECIRCPSQSQNGYIICIECLVNWQTWILNTTCLNYEIINNEWKGREIYINENLIEKMQNSLYTYGDGELRVCNYCFLFCDPYKDVYNCHQINVNHLGQPVFVYCFYGYDDINQVCLPKEGIETYNEKICGFKCQTCDPYTKKCLQCVDRKDILLINEQDCQQCTIPNCKYCFQYLDANQIIVSTLISHVYKYTEIDEKSEALNEDYLIGCALCDQNFTFNFLSMKCELKQITYDQCIDYYINSQGNQVCLTTLTKDFNQGYELSDCSDYIFKCLKCVQSNRKKLFCTQCTKGYYINNFGTCNQCDQQFTECVPDYIIENNSYVTQIQPFLQAISKSLQLAFKNFEYQSIYGICQGSKAYSQFCSIEIEIPYCLQYQIDSCTDCLSNINFEKIILYEGKCFKCPHLCSYCQPKSSKNNLFCLQTDFEQFSIDQFTGRPIPKKLNYVKELQHLIYSFDNYIQLYEIESNLIFSKVIISIDVYIEYFTNFLVDIPYKNPIYNDLYISRLVVNSKLEEFMVCPFRIQIYSFNEIIIKDFQISLNEQFCENIIIIKSVNSTKITFDNITITLQQQINLRQILFSWDDIDYIEFYNLKIDFIQLQDIPLFYIQQNITKNGISVKFENVLFQNCLFINTSIIQVQLADPNIETNIIYFNNVSFINCTLKQLKIIQVVGEQNKLQLAYINFTKISIINCIIEEFQFIENYQTNSSTFSNIKIINTNFAKTNIFLIHSSAQFQNFEVFQTNFTNSCLVSTQSNSRLIQYSQIFQFSKLSLIEITSDTNLIKIQHDYYQNVQFYNIIIIDLYQNYNQNLSQFLFFIQAQFVLIQDYTCQHIAQSSFQISIINSKYITIQNVQVFGSEQLAPISHEKNLDSQLQQSQQNLIYILSSKLITLLEFNITNLKIDNSNFIQIQDDQNILLIKFVDFYISNIILVQELGIYETTLIKFQIDKASNIFLDNFNLQHIFGNSYEKIRKTSEQLSLLSFISFQSEIQLSNFFLLNNIISNSSNALVYLESKTIKLCNFTSLYANKHDYWLYQYVNTIYFNISIKVLEQLFPIQSEGGVFNIQSQNLTIINVSSEFSRALQGGFCKIELVLESEFNLKNVTVIESLALGGKESKGGSFYINAKDSNLFMKFIDVKVINSYSLYDGGFLYLIPSNIYNKIELRNIIAFNVISLFRGFLSMDFTLQTQQNLIILSKIQINVSFVGFYNNTSSFQELSDNEIFYISRDNGYIYLDYCNLTINDVYLHFDIINQPAISLNKIQNMKFYNVNLEIGELMANSLIYYESYPNSRLKYFSIYHLTLKQNFFQIPLKYKGPCQQIFKEEILIINELLTNSFYLKQKNCLLTQIILNSNLPDQLISIQFLDDQQKFLMQDLIISQFSYPSFQLGLLNIYYQKQFKSRLEQFVFINNSCVSNNKLNISSLQQGENKQIILKKHMFYNNSNSINGQTSISNTNFIISQSRYIQNTAIQKGGAIYLQNSPFNILNSAISQNQANQGGGIFSDKILNGQRIKSLQTTLIFHNSAIYKAKNYGQEYYQLKIDTNQKVNQLINSQSQSNETIKNINFLLHLPSGQQLKSYRQFNVKTLTFSNDSISLSIKIQNYFQEDQILNNFSILCNIQQDLLNENFTIIQSNISFSEKYFNIEESSLNLDEMSFILNPYSNNYLQVGISCDAIYNLNYRLYFYLKAIKCQMGEYFQDNQCLTCNSSKGFYSVDPLAGQCEKSNPNAIRNHTENLIDLYPEFWRYDLYSSIIELCSNEPKNCLGGWSFGDDTCLEGTLGALCQECDLYNIRGFGKYSKTKEFTCLLCGDQGIILLEFFFVFIWVLLQIALTVKSTQLQNQNFLFCKAQTKMYDILVRLSQDQSGTVIKLISNYFQIVLVVYTFQLKFISNIEDLFKFVGNSTYSTTNNFDCYLSYLDVDYIYLNLAFVIFIQLIQYLLYISFSYLLQKFQLNNYTQETLYSSFFYLYLSGFLNLIKILSSLLTPKKYGEQEWISANVSRKYWTSVHLKAVYFLILPLLIFFGLILPLILLLTLNQNKKNFNNYSIKQKFGYLFNEYQNKYYYWELIRLAQRFLLTLIIVLLQDFFITKGILLIGLLFSYYLLFNMSKPHNVGKLNKFEKQCLILCIISLLLCLFVFSILDYSTAINYIIQVLILGSLLYLVLQCLMKFISVHISKYEGLLDIIRIIIKKHIRIEYILKSKYLELSVDRKARIKRLFTLLKNQKNKNFNHQIVFTNILSDHRYTQVSVEGKDEQTQKGRLI